MYFYVFSYIITCIFSKKIRGKNIKNGKEAYLKSTSNLLTSTHKNNQKFLNRISTDISFYCKRQAQGNKYSTLKHKILNCLNHAVEKTHHVLSRAINKRKCLVTLK